MIHGRDKGELLEKLVGERGFEPPTPWSRTRFGPLWNSIDSSRTQLIANEWVRDCQCETIEPYGPKVL
jgi:hypothetical protein